MEKCTLNEKMHGIQIALSLKLTLSVPVLLSLSVPVLSFLFQVTLFISGLFSFLGFLLSTFYILANTSADR